MMDSGFEIDGSVEYNFDGDDDVRACIRVAAGFVGIRKENTT